MVSFLFFNTCIWTMTAIGSMITTIPTTTIILMLAIIILLTCLLGLMLDTENIILNQTNRKLNAILSIVSKNWLLIQDKNYKLCKLDCEAVESNINLNRSNTLEMVSYEDELLERAHHNSNNNNNSNNDQ